MLEDELLAEVLELCASHGVRTYRAVAGVRAQAGWPDLVLWSSWLIFRELKSTTGRCSRRQLELGRSLVVAGQDWGIWRPTDLESGLIEEQIASL